MGCGVNERRLGKIKVVKFGLGGYQDMMIGVNFTLGGESWGELERVKSSKVVFNFIYPNISKYARIRIPKNKKIKADIVTL